jgi:tetratricopeptide (TPR) repeat protein
MQGEPSAASQTHPTGAGMRTGAGAAALATQFQHTVQKVRSLPVLGIRIPTIAFLVIVVVLFGGLAFTITTLKSKVVAAPSVDTRAEAQRAQEREIRNQANQLLKNGHVTEAYEKYQELLRIAPNSPAINSLLQQINAARAVADVSRQQAMKANEKYNEGMQYYNEQDFANAIPLLQEAAALNPASEEIARTLQQARIEQAKIEQAKSSRAHSNDGLEEMVTPAPRAQRPPH